MRLRQAMKIMHANKHGYFEDLRANFPSPYRYGVAVTHRLKSRKLKAITRINKWYRNCPKEKIFEQMNGFPNLMFMFTAIMFCPMIDVKSLVTCDEAMDKQVEELSKENPKLKEMYQQIKRMKNEEAGTKQ